MHNVIEKMLPMFFLFWAGCSSFDGVAIRENHARDYQGQLTDKTDELLSKKEPLGLTDCIEFALANNLNMKSAKIQQRIASFERKVAFSTFLPVVNLDYQYTRWDRQPKIKFGSSAAAMHDERIRQISWQIQMSIFDPSTWFLYSMHQRGEEIARLVTDHTRQMTILEVTINYYHCLSLEQAQSALESGVKAAVELEKRIHAFYDEGIVTQWQLEQAQVHLLARRRELGRFQYALRQAKGDLLSSMGLSPLAEILLKTEEPLEEPADSLEGLVAETLILNPQLHIADRRIAIEKEKVKVALAGFLPRLVGFANRTHSSDSYLLYDNFWTYGLAGAMTLFNGFANINEYKAAKQRKQEAFVKREQQTLVLILEVVKAYLNLEDAKEESFLAQRNYEVSLTHLEEIEQNWTEGLVDSSALLAVIAEKDAAHMEAMNSRFQLQVSMATLYNVIGITGKNYGTNHDEEDIAKSDG